MDLGRLAPASEVTGSEDIPYYFKKGLSPEIDGQDPFQICGGLCQTRKTPTLEQCSLAWQARGVENRCTVNEIGYIFRYLVST
jgi:hypothetical protein